MGDLSKKSRSEVRGEILELKTPSPLCRSAQLVRSEVNAASRRRSRHRRKTRRPAESERRPRERGRTSPTLRPPPPPPPPPPPFRWRRKSPRGMCANMRGDDGGRDGRSLEEDSRSMGRARISKAEHTNPNTDGRIISAPFSPRRKSARVAPAKRSPKPEGRTPSRTGNVQGGRRQRWKVLTDCLNAWPSNLTGPGAANIADVAFTTGRPRWGDLSRRSPSTFRGEILEG